MNICKIIDIMAFSFANTMSEIRHEYTVPSPENEADQARTDFRRRWGGTSYSRRAFPKSITVEPGGAGSTPTAEVDSEVGSLRCHGP